MHPKMAAYAVAASVILALGVPAAGGSSTLTRAHEAHAAGRLDRVTACGVERWAVKTGMDPDARLVNQKVVVPTNIIRLRSLPAPAYLPVRSRLRPVETTVWAVDAILLRYKVEEDSDVHLVIADTGGPERGGTQRHRATPSPSHAMGRDGTFATVARKHASSHCLLGALPSQHRAAGTQGGYVPAALLEKEKATMTMQPLKRV
jgi:hypothetical protein